VIEGLYLLSLALFLVTWRTDPGFIEQRDRPQFMRMLAKCDPATLCPYCETSLQPFLQSKHCLICNRCVKGFDHHCLWLGNCIGDKNHKLFIAFLLATLCLLSTTIYVLYPVFTGTIDPMSHRNTNSKTGYLYLSGLYELDHLIFKCLCIVNLIPALIFLLPLSYLLFIQAKSYWGKLRYWNTFASSDFHRLD